MSVALAPVDALNRDKNWASAFDIQLLFRLSLHCFYLSWTKRKKKKTKDMRQFGLIVMQIFIKHEKTMWFDVFVLLLLWKLFSCKWHTRCLFYLIRLLVCWASLETLNNVRRKQHTTNNWQNLWSNFYWWGSKELTSNQWIY
jgi:hypothetical protein